VAPGSDKRASSFGVASDVQHADKDDTPSDFAPNLFRDSISKIDRAVSQWNIQPHLAFVIHLGDIIDGNSSAEKTEGDLRRVLDVFSRCRHLVFHVVGNHCLRIPRDRLLDELELASSYYDFVVRNFRFIVLDTTDFSLGHPPESPIYKLAQKWLEDHPLETHLNSRSWNGGLTPQQLEWFRGRLCKARRKNQTSIVFGHHPLSSASSAASHMAWDHEQVVAILEDHARESLKNVVYFNGHYHRGGYALENGVHYVTVQAILNAPEGADAYGSVDLYEDRVVINGTGELPSRELHL